MDEDLQELDSHLEKLSLKSAVPPPRPKKPRKPRVRKPVEPKLPPPSKHDFSTIKFHSSFTSAALVKEFFSKQKQEREKEKQEEKQQNE